MNARRKGVEFERAICRAFKAEGFDAERCFQFREGGAVPDVHAGRFWVECKSGRLNVAAIYRATATHCRNNEALADDDNALPMFPAVVHKSSRTGPALVTISLSDLFRLIRDTRIATERQER